MPLTPWLILLLFLVALVAGFVDAIAGGGGLLTVPALLLAGVPADLTLGTNKGQSVFGSGASLLRFAHSPLIDHPRARVSLGPALLGAVVGATLVSYLAPDVLTPLVMALLAAVAVFMLIYRPHASHRPPRRQPWIVAALVALLIAAYDGFFGPGTGTLAIMACVLLWHDPLDAASANAKVINFASNLAAMALFAAKGKILWPIALPMGLGQFVGGWLGAHVTIRVGRNLVRYAVLLVALALIVRLGYRVVIG